MNQKYLLYVTARWREPATRGLEFLRAFFSPKDKIDAEWYDRRDDWWSARLLSTRNVIINNSTSRENNVTSRARRRDGLFRRQPARTVVRLARLSAR